MNVTDNTSMPQLLTVAEAAARLRITPKLLRDLIRQGQIPALRVGRTWRLDPETLRPPSSPPDHTTAEDSVN